MSMKTFWWTQIIVEMACRKDNGIIVSDCFNGKLKLKSSFLAELLFIKYLKWCSDWCTQWHCIKMCIEESRCLLQK